MISTRQPGMPPSLRRLLMITDLFFIAYWSMTLLQAAGIIHIDPSLLYSDYDNPDVTAWNWSFFPLDVILSVIGLASVRMARNADPRWQGAAIISLTLTVCAGLMAIAFWAFKGDFDPLWWAVNLFFLIWPLPWLWRALTTGQLAA